MGADQTRLTAMNITVAGLWHLGSVTAACCARHFRVTGYDPDSAVVASLNQGQAPLFEPGLNEAIHSGLSEKRLRFTSDPQDACQGADVIWCAWDTPVDDQDEADVASVLHRLGICLGKAADGTLVLVSSQLPVGTCRRLESEFPRLRFACSPENLRLGKAIEAFTQAQRVIVGLRDESAKPLLETLFAPFTKQVLWMGIESAEMVKHGLNAFLALSITFINEIGRLCEKTGADAREVAAGLKSDPRIGPRAYLNPGGPFAGGTLARDVVTLTRLSDAVGESSQVIAGIKPSNDHQRGWALRKLREKLNSLPGRTVTVLGLTYTPNTDTLRRSAAVELCRDLLREGARVRAVDPAVRTLPEELQAVELRADLASALVDTDAAVVCTEWPQFRESEWSRLVPGMRRRLILDANAFLEKELKSLPEVEHLCVGRAT